MTTEALRNQTIAFERKLLRRIAAEIGVQATRPHTGDMQQMLDDMEKRK